MPSIFFGSFAFVFLNFGLPIRADDLGIDAISIGGMYAIFTGTMLIIRPLVGRALDRVGRRRFFVSAFVFYVGAMLLFSIADSLLDFYLARFAQGIGASLMWVTARTMIGDIFQTDRRGEEMGKLTTTSVRGSMIGATIGFTLLGFMPLTEAWVYAFCGYALLSLIALTWAVFKVNETKNTDCLEHTIVSIEWSQRLKQSLLIVFFTAFGAALTEPIYLLFLKSKFNLDILTLAMVFLPSGLVYAFLPKYAGRWSDQIDRRYIIAGGLGFAGIILCFLPYWPSIWFFAISYIGISTGWAIATPAQDALVIDLAHEKTRGRVVGMKEASAGIGAACGPLIGGFIYEHFSNDAAFVANGILMMFASALMLWFQSKDHKYDSTN